MNRSTYFYLIINLAGLWLISFGLAACGGSADAPSQPTINFKSLDDGSEVNLGQAVSISYEAADVKGVTQVELTINGQPIHIEAVTPPVNVFSGSYVWTPESGGSYLLQLVAFNVDGVSSPVAQVAVTVSGETATVAPTATLVSQTAPTDTPTSVVASPTPAEATATPTVEAADVGSGAKPMVTTLIGLNVRAGPGTNYPVVGRILAQETAEITGRNEAASWWQIVFDSGVAERGWIAAGAEFSTATNADNVPVVEAPTPPEPIGSANNDRPVIDRFEADPDTITAGENVLLSWDLRNATEAFLRFDGKEEGVVAPGSKTVAPTKDTVYTLIARNDAGETTREVTVRVGEATATPASVSESGTLNVSDGQTIDFDNGAVQGDGGAGADFFWSAQQKEFKSRNGAIGSLINKGFADITLADCTAASYGVPISGIDGSQPIAGCYRTNEDRFGKFAITNWDLTGRLTIEWVTWRN
jgi:hypothetical protein